MTGAELPAHVAGHIARCVAVLGLVAWLSGCVTAPSKVIPNESAQETVVSKTDPVNTLPVDRFELMPSPQALQSAAQDAPGEPQRELERGTASWYGPRFHGRRTASGERYDQQALTAAHRTLPFGTLVRVRSLVNGREIEVRITDRGPYALGAQGRSRIIDVSRAAAVELDMMGLGVKEVVLFVAESVAMTAQPPRRAPLKKRQSVRKQPSR